LNRPPVNAINAEVRNRLIEIFDEATDRDDIRVVVLTGQGKIFSAGADPRQRPDAAKAGSYWHHNRIRRETGWRIRNAAAATLALTEDQMRRAIRAASVEDLTALIETFSPARSTGPDWTRTFEPLIERLWAWRDADTLAALADVFGANGMPWLAVAHALSPDHVTQTRHPAWARQPAFAVA
jgi:hypothetical protein